MRGIEGTKPACSYTDAKLRDMTRERKNTSDAGTIAPMTVSEVKYCVVSVVLLSKNDAYAHAVQTRGTVIDCMANNTR